MSNETKPARAPEPSGVGSGEKPGLVVRLEHITKAYHEVVANDDITVEFLPGQVHSIVGENGAGKSTLMSVLFGLIRPDSGQVIIGGEALEHASPRDAIRAGIALVQQYPALISTLTVAEHLVLSCRHIGRSMSLKSASAHLTALGAELGLPVQPDVPVSDLRPGDRHRSEIVKSIVLDAKLLALDEPTAVLGPHEAAQLAETMRSLAERGLAVVFISHKLQEVVSISDHVTVLRRGQVVASLDRAQVNESSLAKAMIGSLVDTTISARGRHSDGPPRLQLHAVVVQGADGSHAVRGVDLEVHGGEVVGLAGVEGNGQVELTEAIAGVRDVQTGRIEIDGEDVAGQSVARRRALGLGHVPSDRKRFGLVGDLSVAENFVLPVMANARFGRFGLLQRSAVKRHADLLMNEYDIRAPTSAAATSGLSGGNQQKVILARELNGNPGIVICCYPTIGLDLGAARAVRERIRHLRDEGAAVLYASTDLDEILEVSDRVSVMHGGRLVGSLSADEATAERLGLMMGGTMADVT